MREKPSLRLKFEPRSALGRSRGPDSPELLRAPLIFDILHNSAHHQRHFAHTISVRRDGILLRTLPYTSGGRRALLGGFSTHAPPPTCASAAQPTRTPKTRVVPRSGCVSSGWPIQAEEERAHRWSGSFAATAGPSVGGRAGHSDAERLHTEPRDRPEPSWVLGRADVDTRSFWNLAVGATGPPPSAQRRWRRTLAADSPRLKRSILLNCCQYLGLSS